MIKGNERGEWQTDWVFKSYKFRPVVWDMIKMIMEDIGGRGGSSTQIVAVEKAIENEHRRRFPKSWDGKKFKPAA